MAAPSEDARQRAQDCYKMRIAAFYAELLVEGAVPETASPATGSDVSVAAEALRLAITLSRPSPKYFSGEPPRQEAVDDIDAVLAGGTQHLPVDCPPGKPEPDRCATDLCGDFFHLCMALKPRKGSPATAQDANFDPDLVDRFFAEVSPEAQEASCELLGGIASAIVEQGCSELASSPAKLRAVLFMLAHPRLYEPTDEAFEVFRRVLELIAQIHTQPDALETMVRWFSAMGLQVLERHVVQVQQFATLSILEGQAKTTNTSSMEAVATIARTDNLARHTRNALRLLDIYWRANERKRLAADDWRARRKVAKLESSCSSQTSLASVYHNDAINECEGILKHDLKEVLEHQHRGAPQREEALRKDFGITEFPFVLTPVSKVRMLNIESLLMQREEVRMAMTWQMMLQGRMLSMNPFLVIKVKRTAIVEDALQQLAKCGPQHFKKPLKVIFEGEEGVDEGGVQKEFFQLLVEELYNEDYGMFERIDESRNCWFNKNSFEANLQFELFGIVLGLAIYNQVILDVKFPRAVYKKLMGDKDIALGLSDLLDFQPALAQGFIALLEHENSSNFEELFGPLSYVVEYDCFGSKVQAELKEGGRDIPVTYENREDYVQRYCDWIFNTSVERQYGAFRKGFDKCIGDTLFRQLFRYDELELVICGSMELDFRALEKSTQYQDGFNASSEPVRWFWEVVHELTQEEKKQLLMFCTGCDRAPVGGLGRLTFIVSRAGPDSDMLPSVHTCFNHLLLPAYRTKEKLEQRLRLAIQHSQGFGLM